MTKIDKFKNSININNNKKVILSYKDRTPITITGYLKNIIKSGRDILFEMKPDKNAEYFIIRVSYSRIKSLEIKNI